MVVDLSLKPIHDDWSRFDPLIFEARDVTEHKRDQEMLVQAQKMEILGRLASGIAHDLNNLLAVIGGNLELAGRRLGDDEAVTARLDKALDAVFQGRSLTDQIFAFARKRSLYPQIVDLNRIIKESEELFRRAWKGHSAMEIDLHPALWPCQTDPARLQMALLNVLIHTGDAIPNGGEIAIQTSNLRLGPDHAKPVPDLADGDYVVLTVSDEREGEGEDKATGTRGKLADQVVAAKEPGQGSGFGLSMAFGLVKSSGGALGIESAPGAGTRISVYLPRSLELPRETDTGTGTAVS